jgi:hypothetical protein
MAHSETYDPSADGPGIIPIHCSNGGIHMGFDARLGYGLCFQVSAIRAEDASDVFAYTRSVLHGLLGNCTVHCKSERTVHVEFIDSNGLGAASVITICQFETHVLVHFKRCSSNREGDRELFLRVRTAFTDLAGASARLLVQTDALVDATARMSLSQA